jgi:spermidine synthase
MNGFRSGWYFETVKGLAIALQVDKILHEEKTSYHDIVLFKSTHFGSVLVVDGMIQCTERDEFPYHEMMAHLPLFSHPKPKKVLIIGGGDGGVVREVDKHDGVEEIHLCEIDERVIEVSKEYLPSIAHGLSSSKLTIHIADGIKYLEDHVNEFDVIITDSTDPVGPAVPLFEKPYYQKINQALRSGGILCSQGECIWFCMDLISNCLEMCNSIYPSVDYAYTSIPTYPSGVIGFILASKAKDVVFSEPLRNLTADHVKLMNLKYYNSDLHRASFVLPQFANKLKTK